MTLAATVTAGVLDWKATFAWGCLGGLLAYLVAFALPELRALYQNFVMPPPGKIVLALSIAVVLIGIGGGAAVFLGDATLPRHAIAYGLGAEGVLAGVIRTATLPPPPPPPPADSYY